MDKKQAIEKVAEFIEAIKIKYHPQKVVLFGSYQKRNLFHQWKK